VTTAAMALPIESVVRPRDLFISGGVLFLVALALVGLWIMRNRPTRQPSFITRSFDQERRHAGQQGNAPDGPFGPR
jgi:hypothetical protein